MSSHQGQLVDSYLQGNFGSRQVLVPVAIVVELDCQAVMWNLIKSLAEIQQNCINLLPSVKSNFKVMYGGDELYLTRSPFPEVMLKITQDLVTFRNFMR